MPRATPSAVLALLAAFPAMARAIAQASSAEAPLGNPTAPLPGAQGWAGSWLWVLAALALLIVLWGGAFLGRARLVRRAH